MTSRLRAHLSTLSTTLYRGPVKQLVRALGLEPAFKSVYSRLLSLVDDDIITHDIAGTTARFHNTRYVTRNLPERSVFEDLLSRVRPDDVFYDLGANRGMYTCLTGRSLTDGQIVSFEPNPNAMEWLRKNVELNEIGGRTTLYQAAVSDSEGETEFVVKDKSTGNTLAVDTKGGDDQTIQIDTVRVDTRIQEDALPQPTVVKIDVEGAEYDAIRGMETALSREECRLVYCELHEQTLRNLGHDAEQVLDVIESYGFDSIETIYDRSDDHYIVRARRVAE